MTIITALFAVGCVVLVTKLPRLVRGEGANTFAATLLLTLSIGLAIPQPYLVVDRLLGGRDVDQPDLALDADRSVLLHWSGPG